MTHIHNLATMMITMALVDMQNCSNRKQLTPEEVEARRKQRDQDEADNRRYRDEQLVSRRATIEAVAAPIRAERLARKRAAFENRMKKNKSKTSP